MTPGTPTNGVNSVQKITVGSGTTGGTFRLKFGGETTGPVAWSGTNADLLANVQNALRGLPSIGVDGVTCTAGVGLTAGIGDVVLTFSGRKTAKLAVPAVTVASNSLTGNTHTLTAALLTSGVTADGRSFGLGAMCVSIAEKIIYVTTAAGPNVAWTKATAPPSAGEMISVSAGDRSTSISPPRLLYVFNLGEASHSVSFTGTGAPPLVVPIGFVKLVGLMGDDGYAVLTNVEL